MATAERELIARLAKTETAEVRVSQSTWKGRRVVDMRLWFIPAGGGEFVPSRKGFTFSAEKLPELIAALRSAA